MTGLVLSPLTTNEVYDRERLAALVLADRLADGATPSPARVAEFAFLRDAATQRTTGARS